MTMTVRRLYRYVPAIWLAIVACSGQSPATTPDDDDSLLGVEPGVVISADASNNSIGDSYTITGRPVVDAHMLRVTVQYGGGCARHEFRLFASHVFMESHPVQSPLAVRHNANGDMCRALLTRDLRFDLTALRDAWRRSYKQEHGTIILRLRGYTEGVRYDF